MNSSRTHRFLFIAALVFTLFVGGTVVIGSTDTLSGTTTPTGTQVETQTDSAGTFESTETGTSPSQNNENPNVSPATRIYIPRATTIPENVPENDISESTAAATAENTVDVTGEIVGTVESTIAGTEANEASPVTPDSAVTLTAPIVAGTDDSTSEATLESTFESSPTTTETLSTETVTSTAIFTGTATETLVLSAQDASTDPLLSLGISCDANQNAVFTITNIGQDMITPGSYEVKDALNIVTLESGQIPVLAAGASFGPIVAIGNANIYVTYTYDAADPKTVNLRAQGRCIPPPTATFTATGTFTPTATRTFTFTPSNTYTPSNTFTPSSTYTASSTYTPSNTATATFTPTSTFTPSNTYTRTYTFTPSSTYTPSNTFTPSSTYTASNTYTPSNTATATFTPTNTFTPSSTYTPSNTFTPSSTYTASNTYTPSNTATATFTPTNTFTPSSTFTASNTFTPSSTYTASNTYTPSNTATATPTSTPDSDARLDVFCNDDFTTTFVINNISPTPITGASYTLEEPGEPPVVQNFNLPVGGKLNIERVAGDAFITVQVNNGRQTVLFAQGSCLRGGGPFNTDTPTPTPTALSASATNTSTPVPTQTATNTQVAQLVATNTPTATLTPIDTATQDTQVQPPISQPPQATNTQALPTVTAVQIRQVAPTQLANVNIPVTPTATPLGYECGDAVATDVNGFPIINMERCAPDVELPRPAWQPLSPGGGFCPDWLLYHTNQTTNWEVFRLGEIPGKAGANPNISLGFGAGNLSVAPARSPDSAWAAFASQRDGNWEIYLGATDGTGVRRITYNTFATDIDPVWSPDGSLIVYESVRSGNWDLYMFDVTNGEERRLTVDPDDDLNAFFSPDGSRIIFQSSRDGIWQIYEHDLTTGVERKLTDGTNSELDPQYSPDGTQIIYRSLEGGTAYNSVLYVMTSDGGEIRSFSEPTGDALNMAYSSAGRLVAYQMTMEDQTSIYVYDFETDTTRKVTDDQSTDYAPTWYCDSYELVWTSDVTGDSNLFAVNAMPIDAPAIDVLRQATQLTTDPASDQYPQNFPAEENASRGRLLPTIN